MSSSNSSQDQHSEASAFLRKTYSILMDSDNKDIVAWSRCGTKFSILDHERFASEVLPRYFKHNNTKSFRPAAQHPRLQEVRIEDRKRQRLLPREFQTRQS